MTAEHTTPLERDILTHYCTLIGPYMGGSEYWKPVHCEAVQRFIELDLLVSVEDEQTGVKCIRANYEALRPYMAALAAVPLPTRVWTVVPP